VVAALLLGLICVSSSQATPFHRKPTSGHARRVSSHATKHATKLHGQQNIDTERAKQIQTALVREHYMSGEPTGVWDQSSKDAMTRYQADHGWQTKVTPDSRALIKLGLGPEQAAGTQAATAAAPAPVHPAPTGSLNGGTLQASAPSSTPPAHTLGSAISAHNTQNLVLP
jgi:hypothetical protein